MKKKCVEKTEAVKTAGDACSLLAKYTSDLVGQWTGFLIWNIYFAFFLPVVDCTVLQEYWRVTSWKYSRSNIAQTNFLCYDAAFKLLL